MTTATLALIPVVNVYDAKAALPAGPGWDPEPVLVSPLAAAQAWYEQGARRIQVIDAQCANGSSPNGQAITELVHGLRGQVCVDLVAGVYDDQTLSDAMRIGPRQIVVSTAAAADLEFVKRAVDRHGEHLTLRLVIGDGGSLHAPGTPAHGLNVFELLDSFEAAGVPRYLVNDATRVGHWWRSHQDVLLEFCQMTSRPVTAGSGVDSLEHLHELCELVPLGLDGAVIGHALDTGIFTFADAQAAVAARYDPYEWGPAQP